MRRLLLAVLALALLLGGASAEAQRPARMNEFGWTSLGVPVGGAAGCVGTFLGTPVSLGCDAGLQYDPTLDTLSVLGAVSARDLVATGTLTGRGVLARGSTVAMGAGPATASLAGTLYVTTTQGTTTGTTEQTLATYTMPANTLATNGRGVRITASYTHAANTNSTIAYVKFGGQQVAVRVNSTSGGTTRITAEVIRTGAATQWSSALATAVTTGQALSGALTIDLTADVAITATATTGTSAGDLTLNLFVVEAI